MCESAGGRGWVPGGADCAARAVGQLLHVRAQLRQSRRLQRLGHRLAQQAPQRQARVHLHAVRPHVLLALVKYPMWCAVNHSFVIDGINCVVEWFAGSEHPSRKYRALARSFGL